MNKRVKIVATLGPAVEIRGGKRFGDETVMYYSDQYMQLARSTVKPGMDMYTVPRNMKEYMHTREEYLENQAYKYLYVDTGNFKFWDEK